MTTLCPLLVAMMAALAQPAPAQPQAAGHWEGTIEVPGQALQVQVDLAERTSHGWEGTIAIPAQNVKAMPLSGIAVDGTSVTFGMPMVPGSPAFKGALSADGRTMSGDFTQGGATLPFALTRMGEARLEAAPKNPPVGADLEGAWEGTLDAKGTTLRLVLKLSNQDGAATGTLTSVDQGGVVLPVSSIARTGSHVTVTVPAVGGTFDGELKERRLEGT